MHSTSGEDGTRSKLPASGNRNNDGDLNNQGTAEDERLFSQKMLMIEVLCGNRNFKEILKEVETMLRNVTLEQLPSYEIAVERERARALEREKALLAQADKKEKSLIKNLLMQQVSIDIIMKATGLSREEIERLR